jgi:hypothetical protein
MIKLRRTACVLVGAAGMYFFDPSMGKRRRAIARDKLRSKFADRRQRMRRQAALDEGRQRGAVIERSGGGEFHHKDNRSVAEHLHEVIRHVDVPTTDVTVEVADDVVRVRGQVRTNEERSQVLAAVGAQSGDRHVESMLHLPTEPAPNKVASRRA